MAEPTPGPSAGPSAGLSARGAGRGAAFFDVDGTLTTGTTLFRFLEYRFAAEGRPAHAYRHERQRLRAMTSGGVPRTETNRAYFASYAGLDASYVAELAAEWFSGELAHGGFLHGPAVAALCEHQAAEEPVVLVSGSFPAALAPLARHLRVDAVLATEPEIVGGRYSGRVHTPMIGRAKADAARA
ncbi:HAD-IB family phosphatase, partial [Streptomyces daliensis]|nr:HAD-IB family phosphatase [Streptomyces daliensis]